MQRKCLGIALLCVVVGCAGDEAGGAVAGAGGTVGVCDPGRQMACSCSDGAVGAQACDDDGSRWGTCVCAGPVGGGQGGAAGQGGAGAAGEGGAGTAGQGGDSAGGTAGVAGFAGTAGEGQGGSVTGGAAGTAGEDGGGSGGGGAGQGGAVAGNGGQSGAGEGGSATGGSAGAGAEGGSAGAGATGGTGAAGRSGATGGAAGCNNGCNDNDLCTEDLCEDGACSHLAKIEDDLDPCTSDDCDPNTGQFAHEPIDVDDKDACTVDTCGPDGILHIPLSEADLNDGDACTLDECDPMVGAVHPLAWSADWNPCTADACDPSTGEVSRPTISGCWVEKQVNVAEPRKFAAIVYGAGKLFVWGGRNKDDDKVLKDGFQYDPETNALSFVSGVPFGIGALGNRGHFFDGKYVITGGYTAGSFVGAASYLMSGAMFFDPDDLSSFGKASGPGTGDDFAEASVVTSAGLLLLSPSPNGANPGGLGHVLPSLVSGVTGYGITPPFCRRSMSAVSDGVDAFVYGGVACLNGGPVNAGFRWEPTGNTWTEIPPESGFHPWRWGHVGAWAGSRMMVWGGYQAQDLPPAEPYLVNSGSLFDPGTSKWEPMSTEGAPSPRGNPATATGEDLVLIWGGDVETLDNPWSGAIYDAKQKQWIQVEEDGQPERMHNVQVVWTGKAFLFYGWRGLAKPTSHVIAMYYP